MKSTQRASNIGDAAFDFLLIISMPIYAYNMRLVGEHLV